MQSLSVYRAISIPIMMPPSTAKAMDFHGLSCANSSVEAETVRYPLDTADLAPVNASFQVERRFGSFDRRSRLCTSGTRFRN